MVGMLSCFYASAGLTAETETAVTSVNVDDSQDKWFTYRYADAQEASQLLLSNRDYYENLTQEDLNYRMQKKGATLEELEAFASSQTLDFTEGEKAAINAVMEEIHNICKERGYVLPPVNGIVFAKSTNADECDAGGYTHGTQIYLSAEMMESALRDDPMDKNGFRTTIAHELFHCLTRNNPDFRSAMYQVLGFTVVEDDYIFPENIRNIIISNPDVEHHNSYATFKIDGKDIDCVTVFTVTKPFEKPGDNFFYRQQTGLIPIDDLSVMYKAEDASNFYDIFGYNTVYVIDPEETLADNFSYTIIEGLDQEWYQTPEMIRAIDKLLIEHPYL